MMNHHGIQLSDIMGSFAISFKFLPSHLRIFAKFAILWLKWPLSTFLCPLIWIFPNFWRIFAQIHHFLQNRHHPRARNLGLLPCNLNFRQPSANLSQMLHFSWDPFCNLFEFSTNLWRIFVRIPKLVVFIEIPNFHGVSFAMIFKFFSRDSLFRRNRPFFCVSFTISFKTFGKFSSIAIFVVASISGHIAVIWKSFTEIKFTFNWFNNVTFSRDIFPMIVTVFRSQVASD